MPAFRKATIPLLDYERYQLTFETARKNLIRSQAELLNKEAELEDALRESELEVRQAEAAYERIRLALDATEIRAQKSGFIIYGENRWTGSQGVSRRHAVRRLPHRLDRQPRGPADTVLGA